MAALRRVLSRCLRLFLLYLIICSLSCKAIRTPKCYKGGNAARLARSLAAITPRSPRLVGPEEEALRIFSSRLGLGQLRHLGRGFFAYWPTKQASDASTANGEGRRGSDPSRDGGTTYPPAVADFLSVCPVFFVSDRRGRLITASYPAADPAALPALAEGAAVPTSATVASTPAHAAFALGVYFMSPRDAADYLHHIDEGSRSSSLRIRAMPMSKAYESLRYVHPEARGQAAIARASSASSRIPFLPRLLFAAQRLRREEGRALRCILLPNTETLGQELAGRKEPFVGTPVYALPPIEVRPGSSLHKALQRLEQQQKQLPGENLTRTGEDTKRPYRLSATGKTSPDRWVITIRFNGQHRLPIFCNANDAREAYEAFRAQLPKRQLPPTPTLKVYSLESLIDRLSFPKDPEDESGSAKQRAYKLHPLLLPDTESLSQATKL